MTFSYLIIKKIRHYRKLFLTASQAESVINKKDIRREQENISDCIGIL